MDNKYSHEYSNKPISDELDDQDKEFIKSMYGWKESVQIPMLTDKVILLSKRIKELDKTTSKYSKAIIGLTFILFIVSVFQLGVTIFLGLIPIWGKVTIIVVFFLVLIYFSWILTKKD